MNPSLARSLVAEAVGTALLLAVVVGSGIMGERLAGGSVGLATFGLIAAIVLVERSRPGAVPFAVAAWITAAYWCTASTSFANPAVTIARAFTGTFAGIRPSDVPVFLVAQVTGALAAHALCTWLLATRRTPSTEPQ